MVRHKKNGAVKSRTIRTDASAEERRGAIRPSRRGMVAVIAATLIPILLWQVHAVSERLLLDRLARRSTQLLDLYVEGLRGTLDRYRPIPALLALNPAVTDLLDLPTGPARIMDANQLFERVNDILGADEIYLMDGRGLTLAASNWADDDSFVGRNFAFRPYYREAMQGRLGRYFALGTTSGRRGYYFAAPVRGDRRVDGVMVVKVDIESLESGWGGRGYEIMATDPEGVVFMASRPDWVYRATAPLSEADLTRIARSRRYAERPITPLAGYRVTGAIGGADIIVAPLPASEGRADALRALAVSRYLGDIGWTLRVLADTATIRGQALAATLVAGGIIVVGALLALWLAERRRRLRGRLAQQEREQAILAGAAAELEDRVRERTTELRVANVRLLHEIEERHRTEQDLRQAQEDLVQAGKLAALGQLASGISHELSQPLTAIGAYADNARKLLKRERGDEAVAHLSTISGLVGRAAKIMEHLRVFARKTPTQVGPVAVADVVNQSLNLLSDVGRLNGVEVVLDLPDQPVVAMAEPVRLEQVLINLLQNAADAVKDARTPAITLTVGNRDDTIVVTVSDNGPGIAEEDLPHIFEPFFSTKSVGEGMGLGLSISYGIVDALGGSLRTEPGPDGGAVFTLILRRAPAEFVQSGLAHG